MFLWSCMWMTTDHLPLKYTHNTSKNSHSSTLLCTTYIMLLYICIFDVPYSQIPSWSVQTEASAPSLWSLLCWGSYVSAALQTPLGNQWVSHHFNSFFLGPVHKWWSDIYCILSMLLNISVTFVLERCSWEVMWVCTEDADVETKTLQAAQWNISTFVMWSFSCRADNTTITLYLGFVSLEKEDSKTMNVLLFFHSLWQFTVIYLEEHSPLWLDYTDGFYTAWPPVGVKDVSHHPDTRMHQHLFRNLVCPWVKHILQVGQRKHYCTHTMHYLTCRKAIAISS